MCDLNPATVNPCNVPELPEFRKSGLKQPDRRWIVVGAADSITNKRNSDMGLGHRARVVATVADVSNLETAAAARLQEVDPIVCGQATQVEVRPQRVRQGG
jgi:hypothetical protein